MATTNRLFQDFISFTVDTDPGASGTSLSGPGLADLLVVADPDFIALTLDPEEVSGAAEIIWVSAHSSSATTATIVREQEGTTGRAHPIGTVVVAGVTAVVLDRSFVTARHFDPIVEDFSTNPRTETVELVIPSGWNTYDVEAWATLATVVMEETTLFYMTVRLDIEGTYLGGSGREERMQLKSGADDPQHILSISGWTEGLSVTGSRTVTLTTQLEGTSTPITTYDRSIIAHAYRVT